MEQKIIPETLEALMNIIKEVGNCIDTTCEEMEELAKGLGEDNEKIVRTFIFGLEDSRESLIGIISRMKRIPSDVKLSYMKALGANLNGV